MVKDGTLGKTDMSYSKVNLRTKSHHPKQSGAGS